MSIISGFKKYKNYKADENGDHQLQSFWTSSDSVDGNITEASTRTNLVNGETLTTSLGKIKKFFSDLGTSAFKNTTDTYSGTGTDPVTGKAVKEAIDGLDVTGASNIAASKTIKAWSETDGKVSITTQDIAISNSQISGLGTASTKDVPSSGDASSTEVVMGDDSRLTDARPSSDVTDTYSSSGTVPVSGKAVASAIGELDVTGDSNISAGKTIKSWSETDGKVSVTTQNISITKSQVSDFPTLGTAAAKDTTDTYSSTGTDPVTGKAVASAIGGLDVSAVGGSGKYLTTISETDGKISATAETADTTVTQNSSKLITSGAVWTAIDNLPEPLVFKGTLGAAADSPTITSLPTASSSNEGWTYLVITDGTYASQAAKVGDRFACATLDNGTTYQWIRFKAGDPDTDTWRNIKVNGTEKLGNGISTGGVDFVNGTNTTVAFDTTGNKVSVSVPAVSSSSAGVAPKGNAVSSQSQTTKFLREDGSWAAPSYTTNTNTTYSLTQDGTDGHKITLTPSSGTAQTITIPDNNTTYTAGTGLSLSGTEFSVKTGYTTSGNNRKVQADSSGNLYVAQKDTDTTYTFAQGTNNGEIKITPSSGSATTVTPKGLSDLAYIAKGSGSSKYLREDGTWQTVTSGVSGVKGDSEESYRTGNVNITKSNIGLGNVGNFKAVSTVASQGLTDTEKANARTNIGAGTSSFSGAYADLSGKPTIPSKTSQLTNDSGYVTTDTKNTAGSTDTSSKIFLVGATSQAANPQTYSHDTAYVGTDGCLYSGGTKVLTSHQDISGKADKSATVSTVTWDSTNKKLTKTINGTTTDVVTGATILGGLTKSQVTTALGYTPPTTDTNTTYTFAGGTNKFTVTPSGGTAQDVTITPSIANNVTGSGTSGYLAKFNGANTVTSGPQLGSSTTTYLRNDGSWATPPDNNTTYTIATGDSNGQIKVTPSSGSAYNVSVKGLGSNAYTSTSYLPLTGGTITGNIDFSMPSGISDTYCMRPMTAGKFYIGTSALPFGNIYVKKATIKGSSYYSAIQPSSSLTANGTLTLPAGTGNIPMATETTLANYPSSPNTDTIYFISDADTLGYPVQDNASATDLSNGYLPTGQTIKSYLNSNNAWKSLGTITSTGSFTLTQDVSNFKEINFVLVYAGYARNSLLVSIGVFTTASAFPDFYIAQYRIYMGYSYTNSKTINVTSFEKAGLNNVQMQLFGR